MKNRSPHGAVFLLPTLSNLSVLYFEAWLLQISIMKEVTDWFKKKEYAAGVQLYASLPGSNHRLLAALKRGGKNDRNIALLCKELRPYYSEELPVQVKVKIETKPVPITKPVEVQTEQERKQIAEVGANNFLHKIRYNDLPPELRLRYRKIKDLFYDMCDLKFLLNDLPAKAQVEALKLQLAIEDLDDEKQLIWKELDHWQDHKSLLPTKQDTDFSKLSFKDLFLMKAKLADSIYKISKRIEIWKGNLEKEKDKREKRKIEQQINRSTKLLHQHQINLKEIEKLL